jgi:hypothetical protein
MYNAFKLLHSNLIFKLVWKCLGFFVLLLLISPYITDSLFLIDDDSSSLEKEDLNLKEKELPKEDSKANTDVPSASKSNSDVNFEDKMNAFMNKHMDYLIKNVRDQITENKTENKEELENAYYDQVDYKFELDNLTNSFEKKLNISDTVSKDAGEESSSKREAEEAPDNENSSKQLKKEK